MSSSTRDGCARCVQNGLNTQEVMWNMAPGFEGLSSNKIYTAVEKELLCFGKEVQHSNSAWKTTKRVIGPLHR